MTIDLTNVDTKVAFYRLMKRELGFPGWYGVRSCFLDTQAKCPR